MCVKEPAEEIIQALRSHAGRSEGSITMTGEENPPPPFQNIEAIFRENGPDRRRKSGIAESLGIRVTL